jgi:hypothetical protein
MLSFGVSNLRRLKLVPPIELKPITILVGRNSSGKSSFLRAFPLLRQSLMTRTSSPILWYGDFVDFGSFDVSVSDNALNESIGFSFVIDKLVADELHTYTMLVFQSSHRRGPIYPDVHFDVSIVRAGDRTRISRLCVRIDKSRLKYEILLGDNSAVVSLKLNDKDVSELLKPIKLELSRGTLFPELSAVRPEQKPETSSSQPRYYREPSAFVEPIENMLKPYLKRVKERDLHVLVSELVALSTTDKANIRRGLGDIGPKSWKNLISDVCGKDKHGLYPRLHDLLSLAALPAILAGIRSHLAGVITSTLYIGPARARSERYYRYQDLAVSEIDPDGKNFPMFLNSLAPYQIRQLSEWIEGLFGYGLNISRERGGGHMSINLVAKGVTSNIVDTGYGVSQILPVLGQIWWARTRKQRNAEESSLSLLAIEQPELHLHPAHQALLADAIVGEIAGSPSVDEMPNGRIQFLIETHSETLVNRLGELVARGKVLNKDIQIVIFEALEDEARLTDVRTSSFSETGELINWPYGFFQPTVK